MGVILALLLGLNDRRFWAPESGSLPFLSPQPASTYGDHIH